MSQHKHSGRKGRPEWEKGWSDRKTQRNGLRRHHHQCYSKWCGGALRSCYLKTCKMPPERTYCRPCRLKRAKEKAAEPVFGVEGAELRRGGSR